MKAERNKWGEVPKPITLEAVMAVYEADLARLRAERDEVLGALRATLARVDALMFKRHKDGTVTVLDMPLERFCAMVDDFDRARALVKESR
jgi:hypothetical protein